MLICLDCPPTLGVFRIYVFVFLAPCFPVTMQYIFPRNPPKKRGKVVFFLASQLLYYFLNVIFFDIFLSLLYIAHTISQSDIYFLSEMQYRIRCPRYRGGTTVSVLTNFDPKNAEIDIVL